MADQRSGVLQAKMVDFGCVLHVEHSSHVCCCAAWRWTAPDFADFAVVLINFMPNTFNTLHGSLTQHTLH